MSSSINRMGGAPLTINHDYDDNSNRTAITHADGKGFTYRYDNLNRETAMRLVGGGYIKNAIYNNRGNIWLLGIGSGAINGYQYDSVGRLNRITTALAGTDADNQFNFGYNPASQVKSRTISNDLYTNSAHYDVERPYEVNGLNQYTSAGPAVFTYDDNGNLTSDGAVDFTYDNENRLVKASGARNANIIYDPLGRLWEVNQGSTATATRFLYDGDALVAEYDGLGTMTNRYVHGGGVDQPLVWYQGSSTDAASQHGLFSNWQGSITAIADATGNAIAVNGYDAYGIPNDTNIGRFQYTGQIWLEELGLYHYKARVYSPTLGRFLQTDPIGYEDQYNLYAYVGNDPVNLVDPSGNRSIHVTDKQGNETIQFLVAFSGSDANNSQAKQDVLDSFKNISTPNNEVIEVIEVSSSRIGKKGVTEAKLSNTGHQSFCKTDTSCADSIGGDTIYIDTSKSDRGPVSGHELGHTGGATDGYEGSTGNGPNRTQPTNYNRPRDDIMSSRAGRTLGSKSINEIKNDSIKRDKTNSKLVCKNAPDYKGC